MSINNTYKIKIVISDGITTRINFDFFIFKKEDLKVKIIEAETNITKELEYGTDYIVENQFNYNNGGYIILSEPTEKNNNIVLYRDTIINQEINFQSLQTISPQNLTKMFDKLTVICQELQNEFYRSLKFEYIDLSMIDQDKLLNESNLKKIDPEENPEKIVALTLKYNFETEKFELSTSLTNPDDKLEVKVFDEYFKKKKATEEEINNRANVFKYTNPKQVKDIVDTSIIDGGDY